MITPGIVIFDPAAFIAQYPAFATVSETALQNNFNLATLQLNNTLGSIVQDGPTRAALLGLLTAHITFLLNGANGDPPSPGLVGRISSAQEGSVSVQTEFQTQSEAAAYFVQSQWGATFWQSTAIFRTARYVVPHRSIDYGEAWPE